MRSVILIACSAVVAVSGCRSHLQVVRPSLVAQATPIAMPADTGFVRRTCDEPDSVLAGTRPCYERAQKAHIRVF